MLAIAREVIMPTTTLPVARRAGAQWFSLIFSLVMLGWMSGWAFGSTLPEWMQPLSSQQSRQGVKPRQQPRSGNKTSTEPISKAALLRAVKLAAEARDQEERAELMGIVVQQVTAQGVDFQLTTADERELRDAGASSELLAAVRLRSEEKTDLLALRDWRAIKESRQASDFDAYLKKYPKSEFASLARERLEQLEWEAIKANGKAADFEAFLQKHPEGKFVETARERLEQLEWEAVKTSDKTADIEAYLKKYPKSEFAPLARERSEQLEWEAAKGSSKADDVAAFLQKHPEGKFAETAREHLEQLEWEAIKASDKTGDLEAYLKKYPAGKFAAAARERLNRLTASSGQSPPKTTTVAAPSRKESPVELVFWTSEELTQHAIKKVTPFYPRQARDARVKGMVKVRVDVSEDGRVTLAKGISGPAMLYVAAEHAARQWLFRPAQHAGVPVKAQGVITFNFVP
jgi:TonB family protein